MQRYLLRILALLATLAVVMAPAPTRAQTPGLVLSAEPFFDGAVKYGEWMPVRVRLENSGGDVNGRVQIRIGAAGQRATVFAQRVELPRGARKEVILYALPNTFSRRLMVEFFATGSEDEPLASQQVQVQPVPNIRLLVGAISDGGEGLETLDTLELRGRRNNTMMLPLTLQTLPDRAEGLRSLDVLAITGVDTAALTPDQRGALVRWVMQGGSLVIGGGPTGARTLAGLPESLQPVAISSDTSVDRLDALATLGGEEIRVPGPFPISVATPVEGAVVETSQDGQALVVSQAVGDGMVFWLALDPSLAPFDGWAGANEFWTGLLRNSTAYPAELPPDISPRQQSAEQMSYALNNLPSLDLPSLRVLAPLLLVYIVVIGPLNYLVLRWQRRMELAWVTIPVLTLAFSTVAYGIGYSLRGGDVIINQIATVEVLPNSDSSTMRTFIGIFSPARQEYQVTMPTDVLVSPVNIQNSPFDTTRPSGASDTVIFAGNPTEIQGLSINQWSLQSLQAEAIDPEISFRLTTDLRTEADTIVGTVRNDSGETLRDVVVALGQKFQRLGDMAPSQEIQVELKLVGMHNMGGPPLGWLIFENELNRPGPNGPPREIQVRQQVLDSLFNSPSAMTGGPSNLNVPIFLGWLDRSPLPVSIDGARVASVGTTLVYSHLPLGYGEQDVALPPGMLLANFDAEGNRYVCYGTRPGGLTPDFDQMELRFTLPPQLRDITIEEAALHMSSDGGWFSAPEIELYDPAIEEWVKLDTEKLRIGENAIEEPSRWFQDGTIRIRAVNAQRDRGGCIFFDLALTGQRSEG